MPADPSKQPSQLRLAFGWFAAPLAWALHLGVAYAIAGWACRHQAPVSLYALSLAALLLALAGVWVGWRNSLRAQSSSRRFIGYSGGLLGLLFVAVIIVQSIPVVLMEGCP